MARAKRETSARKEVAAKATERESEALKAPEPKAPETTSPNLKKRKDGRLEESRNGMQIVYG